MAIKHSGLQRLTSIDIEIAMASYYGYRRNLVVPNVSWGLLSYEVDLLILSKAGYATEIEIKVSKADCKADLKKGHSHSDPKITHLYFALPQDILAGCVPYIPEKAGIYSIFRTSMEGPPRVRAIRDSSTSNRYRFTDEEQYQLARLGTMRIWKLKKKLNGL